MALIKIISDVFDITDRIKEIDAGYYAVYNTARHRYEIHNSGQCGSTFCIVCDTGLDSRVIDKLRKSRIQNIDKILKEIDKNNEILEKNSKKRAYDESSFKLKEMFDYAKKREADCDFSDSYKTVWA